MATIPCFLCGNELRKRTDKNKKPYFVCDPCGVQIFVRGQQGIDNLAQLVKTIKEHDFAFRHHTHTLLEIQAVLAEMRGIKKELEALDSFLDVFASDRDLKDKERARKSLHARIDALLSKLDDIAARNTHDERT